jgi:hypothetical protein
METDYQLKALFRLPPKTMCYGDESDVLTFVSIAGNDHFDTSKLQRTSRRRIAYLYNRYIGSLQS